MDFPCYIKERKGGRSKHYDWRLHLQATSHQKFPQQWVRKLKIIM